MTLHATPIPILSDNYAWLLRCDRTGVLAIVDPAEEKPVLEAIRRETTDGSRLEGIILTHHHDDHVAATDSVRAAYPAASVIGARADRSRLPRLDQEVAEGDEITVGKAVGRVIETPGHTVGGLSIHFSDGALLLSGDTLFSLGCGRLLEGTPEMMFRSLRSLATLPDDTLVCCGHEYTASNVRYAQHLRPDDAALAGRAEEVAALRAAGRSTVPTRLGEEKRLNPFLLAGDVKTFARLRAGKDEFR